MPSLEIRQRGAPALGKQVGERTFCGWLQAFYDFLQGRWFPHLRAERLCGLPFVAFWKVNAPHLGQDAQKTWISIKQGV
jgi:hypothetical protein